VGEYRLRPRAIADLDEIWEYTVSTWNETQAERYLFGLRDALAMLTDQPELGRARDDLHPGLSVLNYSRHLVFYLREDWGIDVVRVPHGSQDVRAHFRSDEPQ
jgi:toxin ParE1/3/4